MSDEGQVGMEQPADEKVIPPPENKHREDDDDILVSEVTIQITYDDQLFQLTGHINELAGKVEQHIASDKRENIALKIFIYK